MEAERPEIVCRRNQKGVKGWLPFGKVAAGPCKKKPSFLRPLRRRNEGFWSIFSISLNVAGLDAVDVELDHLETIKLVQIIQRTDRGGQIATLTGAEHGEREEVDRDCEVLAGRNMNVLGQLQNRPRFGLLGLEGRGSGAGGRGSECAEGSVLLYF